MSNWLISFLPHVSEWPELRRQQRLCNYVLQDNEVKKGDLAFLFAGSYGFSGWGYIKTVRPNPANTDDKMFIELIFDQFQENILAESEIHNHPILVETRKRLTRNFVRLEPAEFNELNRLLRSKGLESPDDLPEFEIRTGKFGVKDTFSLPQELRIAAQTYDLVSLLFVDLDNFKAVNDNHNHAVGDGVIHEALGEIQKVIETKGELFHRSGDEMVVMLPNINASESVKIAESIRRSVEEKDFAVIGRGYVTATIGVATYPENCDNWESLEEVADDILIRTKQSKKNSVSNR